MEAITGDQMLSAVSVVLAVLAALVTLDKAIDVFKKWKQPQGDIERKLREDKARLDEQAKKIDKLEKGVQALSTGVCALLDHELHNGNGEQMQKARDGIQSYLNSLIGGA